MARPKMNEINKRKKVTLTIDPAAHCKMEALKQGGISISELCEKAIEKEYKRALKQGLIGEADLPGQLNLSDLQTN